MPSGSERRRVDYRLSSWLYARALGAVLLTAFVSLAVQAHGLFGDHGITPIADFVASARRAGHSVWEHPSLFWWTSGDGAITAMLWLGAVASVALLVGLVPRLALLLAWGSYLSFVSVGWPFLSFQWDSLLLETSFVSIFFVPWRVWDRLRGHCSPHPVARWAVWWLLARLMFRSAYVKLASGDPSWANLSALEYHYWTQPLPTVLAWYANRFPAWVQKLSCLGMFIIEFVAPVAIFVPRVSMRRAAALSLMGLMVLIAATGNYGFFNALACVLALSLLDDDFLAPVFRTDEREVPPATTGLQYHVEAIAPALVIVLTGFIFVTGTFGPGPSRSLAPVYRWSSFNNYGLFAVMTTERPEIIIEGSRDGQSWEAYEFRYKPGRLDRAPVWVQPHQPRLDWQMWFAALGDFRRNPWLASFMRRLLEAEPLVLELLEHDPFESERPIAVRAVIYRYGFSSAEERRQDGDWWQRSDPRLYAPVLSVQSEPVP